MKFATVTLLFALIFLSCSGGKEEQEMVDLNIINEDGTINNRKAFQKEIEKSSKMTEKKSNDFK